MITYQRNMGPLLSEQDGADEGLEDLVGAVEEGAHDHAGDDHDDRALHHLERFGHSTLRSSAADSLMKRPRTFGSRRPVWVDAGCRPGRTCAWLRERCPAAPRTGGAGGLPLVAALTARLAGH